MNDRPMKNPDGWSLQIYVYRDDAFVTGYGLDSNDCGYTTIYTKAEPTRRNICQLVFGHMSRALMGYNNSVDEETFSGWICDAARRAERQDLSIGKKTGINVYGNIFVCFEKRPIKWLQTVRAEEQRAVCKSCGEDVDLDTCYCGMEEGDHKLETHPFVPIGCNCLRDEVGMQALMSESESSPVDLLRFKELS